MTLETKIAQLVQPALEDRRFRPQLFDLGRDDDRRALDALIEARAVSAVADTLGEQLGELLHGRQLGKKRSQAEIDELVRVYLAGRPLSAYGAWAFYPWSGRLVHVLPEREYRELRHCRNLYKIDPAEQERLGTKTIGVVGLSVGQASAVTLAQEGVGRSFRLADFDALSLSNMNRLRAPVASIGLLKVVIAAREMFEIDPYLTIDIWPEGLNEGNVDAFLTGGGAMDLLVEECDDLFIKLFVRERARAHKIPTVMDTNERGMLDVERFDLEPERPVLHGLLSGVLAKDVKGLPTREKVPYVMRILGQDRYSPRFVPSLMEIDETIGSWPQLASGVALGAALVTDAARRILLGQFQGSGRYFVDLDELVREGADVPIAPPGPFDDPVSPLARETPTLDLPARRPELSRDDIRRLVALGTAAPSGGNIQPWRFVARGSTVRCLVDESQPETLLDFERGATLLAIGAAVENMELGARAAGLECRVRPFPDAASPSTVCELSFSVPAIAPEVPPLAAYISQRVTNRRLGPRVPLAPAHGQALCAAAESAGGRLQLLTTAGALDEIAGVLGATDRLRFLSKRLHSEMISELRWTAEEVEQTRDGVDLATLELTRADLAGIRLARQWSSIVFLRHIGGGRSLERAAKNTVAASSAIGLLTTPGTGPTSYFQGGRALERVWLTASALGLAMQPMTVVLYLWTRLARGARGEMSDAEVTVLEAQRERFLRLFDLPADTAEIMLFRLAHADAPSARSLRKPVDDVLTFLDP
jgi:nitroreductase